jgi:hypothetical protein
MPGPNMANAFFILINTLFIDYRNNSGQAKISGSKVKTFEKENVTLFRVRIT